MLSSKFSTCAVLDGSDIGRMFHYLDVLSILVSVKIDYIQSPTSPMYLYVPYVVTFVRNLVVMEMTLALT